MLTASHFDMSSPLRDRAAEFDEALRNRLSLLDGIPDRLADAMRYSLLSGGKRIRPVLVLLCCEACGGPAAAAIPPAIAIECVHTFSLIHDDLPALDNDDMRRGRPTCHRQFDERTAILAGDALLALAFEVLARDVADPGMSRDMTLELAGASGAAGMIGGEYHDLAAETTPPDEQLTDSIHDAKTARLFQAACRLGGLAAGASEKILSQLGAFGRMLGLAFQAMDDLLDVSGSLESTGKATGKDAASGKQTLPRAIGQQATAERVRRLSALAVDTIAPLGESGAILGALARQLAERTR